MSQQLEEEAASSSPVCLSLLIIQSGSEYDRETEGVAERRKLTIRVKSTERERERESPSYIERDKLTSLPTNSELQNTHRPGRAAVASSSSFRADNEVGVASSSESPREDIFRQEDMLLNVSYSSLIPCTTCRCM